MIVYGWNSKFVGTRKIEGECPSCHSKDMQLVGHQNVFHICWLPVIPLGRETHATCCSCGETYQPETILGEKAAKTERFGIPWWSFSGLFIGLLVAIGVMFWDASKKENIAAFKADPEVGAFFTYKDDDEAFREVPYCYAKVVGIEEDGIVICLGGYSYSREDMANKSFVDSKLNSDEMYIVSADAFQELDIVHFSSLKK